MKRTLLAIFLIALALRLLNLWFASQSSPYFCELNTDDKVYHEWAARIASGSLTDGKPFFLCPLFPYFLGFLYAISGGSALFALIVQAVLSSLTCCLVARAGSMLFGPRAGLFAGLAAALYGPLIFFTEILLTETLHLFLALSAFLLFLECREKERKLPWFACGIVCGLAAVARSTFLLPALLLAAWAAFEKPRRLRGAVLLLAGAAVIAAVPLIHNAVEGDDFVLINSSGGVNFFMGNHKGANGRYHVPDGIPVEAVQNPKIMRSTFEALAERDAGKELKDSEISSFYFKRGLDFIAQNPGEWLSLVLKKLGFVLESFEFPGDRNYYQAMRFSPLLKWTPARYAVILAFALLGFFVTRKGWRELAPLYLLCLSALAVLLGFYVTDRYRLALVPFLIMPAGAGISFLGGALARRRIGPLAAGLIAAACLFGGSVLLSGGKEPESYMSFHNLGSQYIKKEKYAEAEDAIRSAIALSPGYLPARSNLALALSMMPHRRGDAVAEWQNLYRMAKERGSPAHEERALRWLKRLSSRRREKPSGL